MNVASICRYLHKSVGDSALKVEISHFRNEMHVWGNGCFKKIKCFDCSCDFDARVISYFCHLSAKSNEKSGYRTVRWC